MSVVLAFSGGLDTSFCVPFLKENHDPEVYTVTVNTGGLEEGEEPVLEARSKELGALKHVTIDARQELFDECLSYLIKGNVLRGGVYPLSVGTERYIQARGVAKVAQEVGASAIAHGSTGAGNDQVRFDVSLQLFANDLDIIAPIREHGLSREQSSAYLDERGFGVPASTKTYSINKGMWGTTIGGRETLGTWDALPEEAYPDTVSIADTPTEAVEIVIAFERGIPVAMDGASMNPVELILALNDLGAAHGVGRNVHVGDTILGIKGRVGFEAPAARILIDAHKELEKIILTKWQGYQKGMLGDFYGMLLHEAEFFDPVMRDIEAFIDSTQTHVTGDVRVRLSRGNIAVMGCRSDYSMFNTGVATYGETNALWNGRDAEGFSRIHGVQALLAKQARTNTSGNT